MTADRSDLDVSHLGGDAVSNSDLTVIIKAGENRTRIAFAPPSGEFAPGDRRTFSDALVANASNDLLLVHQPSGTVLERASLAPEPAPTVETGVIEGTVVGADPITSAASGATFGSGAPSHPSPVRPSPPRKLAASLRRPQLRTGPISSRPSNRESTRSPWPRVHFGD